MSDHKKIDDRVVRKAFRVWFTGLTQQQRVGLIRGHQPTFNDVLDLLYGDERDTDIVEAELEKATAKEPRP